MGHPSRGEGWCLEEERFDAQPTHDASAWTLKPFVIPSAAEGPAVQLVLKSRLGAQFKPGFGLSGIPHTRRVNFVT